MLQLTVWKQCPLQTDTSDSYKLRSLRGTNWSSSQSDVRSALAPAHTATQLKHQQCGSPIVGGEGRKEEVRTSAILLLCSLRGTNWMSTNTSDRTRDELLLVGITCTFCDWPSQRRNNTTQLTTLCVCCVILTWFPREKKCSYVQGVPSIVSSLGMADLLHKVCIRDSCHAEGHFISGSGRLSGECWLGNCTWRSSVFWDVTQGRSVASYGSDVERNGESCYRKSNGPISTAQEQKVDTRRSVIALCSCW